MLPVRVGDTVIALEPGHAETEIADSGNPHVFSYLRSNQQSVVFVLANFSEDPQRLEARRLRQMGMRKTMVDLHAGRVITATQELEIGPYELMVLTRIGEDRAAGP